MGRVDPELEASGSDGGDNLKENTIVPVGLEEGEVGAPQSLKKKRKEPSAASDADAGGGGDDDASADVIRRLKEEALALMEAAKGHHQPPVKKRKKLVKQRLPKEMIDYMIQRPYKPLDHISHKRLPEGTEEFREWYATTKTIADKILEYQQALINQYMIKGYAENEIEVTDDEGDN